MTKTDIGQLVPDLQPDLSEIRRFLLFGYFGSNSSLLLTALSSNYQAFSLGSCCIPVASLAHVFLKVAAILL